MTNWKQYWKLTCECGKKFKSHDMSGKEIQKMFYDHREKDCPKKHKEKEWGWTGQKSRCDYAGWWDCSFFCNILSQTKSGKLRKGGVRPCIMDDKHRVPDWSKCELNKKRRK